MKVSLKNGEGFRVTWKHSRLTLTNSPMGGVTDCTIIDVTDKVVGEGSAYCHYSDIFSKAVGREISFKRALMNGPFSKEDRTEMWKAFFDQVTVMRPSVSNY